ncbi:uncharacterized protein [Phaseolus vulgaris]|uniref:uncharacterized protein n=1 Tax=Phaseolus vulgaris TaxID=3885 RepID=UPI0035CB2097
MVEKARREYLLQVQETIKMEILMGQTVGPLDLKVAELQAENSSLLERSQMVEELEAENSSLRQQDSQRVEMLKAAKEATAAAEKKLEEAVGQLLPNNEAVVKDVKSFDSEIAVTLGCQVLSTHLRILMFNSSLSKVFPRLIGWLMM